MSLIELQIWAFAAIEEIRVAIEELGLKIGEIVLIGKTRVSALLFSNGYNSRACGEHVREEELIPALLELDYNS